MTQREDKRASNPSAGRPGHIPALAKSEWITYAVLAGALAATNIYTTLETGWGDGGSILAVVAAVMVLRALRRSAHLQSINLGQTMASAGGTMGFAFAAYAAIGFIEPDFKPSFWLLSALAIGAGLVGVVLAAAIRKQMIRYYFPSGTACAIIQRSVVEPEPGADADRPLRLLVRFGELAALWALPVHVVGMHGKALLSKLSLFSVRGTEVAVGLDPVGFGIGLVVGPRVGLGMLIGALVGPLVLVPSLPAGEAAHAGDWMVWCAIAALAAPTFAAMVFAYMFRAPPVVPAGFSPGATLHPKPRGRTTAYAALAVSGLALVALASWAQFELSWQSAALCVAVCIPFAIMNGRVVGETDINPVLLVIIVLLTGFVLAGTQHAGSLLAMMLIGSVVASVSVDTMQDYRTGYLVDANPSHQVTVQFVGVIVGALVAVPIMLLLETYVGFGDGPGQMSAPGPRIYVGLIQALLGEAYMPYSLKLVIAIISVAGCVYAFFAVWPVTAPWMPSLFGAGIGMLVGVEISAAIFIGGVIKWAIASIAARGKRGDDRAAAIERSTGDTMIAGAAIFAAGAITAIYLIVLSWLTGTFAFV